MNSLQEDAVHVKWLSVCDSSLVVVDVPPAIHHSPDSSCYTHKACGVQQAASGLKRMHQAE